MEHKGFERLPDCARDYIDLVLRKMRYRRKVRGEVRVELEGHFVDGLSDGETEEERELRAGEMVAEFGDAAMLGKLLRRGKKRCRPLGVKVLIRTMQVAGVLVLCVVGRAVYLSTGTPVISVDYVEWMNEQVRDGRDEDINARLYYERAVQVSKDVPAGLRDKMYGALGGAVSKQEWDMVEAFVAEDAGAIDALREGAGKPFYWNVYEGEPSEGSVPDLAGQVTGDVMPSLSGYKRLAQKLAFIQIPWSLHVGDLEGAVDDGIVLHRFAQHLSGRGLLIEQLVGMAVEGLAHAKTYEVLSKFDIPGEKLREYQEQLEAIYEEDRVLDLEAEKGFWYDFIQRTFTDDGEGSGRPMKAGLTLAAGDVQSLLKGFVAGYPDRKEVTVGIDRYYARVEEVAGQTPWELKDAGWDEARWEELAGQNLMLNVTGQALGKTVGILWRVRAGRRALVTVLAIKRYEQEKGALPASLEEAVSAGYLEALPQDPYGDKPLRYRVKDDGFVLYSYGSDMKDDGGRTGTKNGEPFKWADDGDWVFWPVE